MCSILVAIANLLADQPSKISIIQFHYCGENNKIGEDRRATDLTNVLL